MCATGIPEGEESRKKLHNDQTFLKFGQRHTFSFTTFSEPQASRRKGAFRQGKAKLDPEVALAMTRESAP